MEPEKKRLPIWRKRVELQCVGPLEFKRRWTRGILEMRWWSPQRNRQRGTNLPKCLFRIICIWPGNRQPATFPFLLSAHILVARNGHSLHYRFQMIRKIGRFWTSRHSRPVDVRHGSVSYITADISNSKLIATGASSASEWCDGNK